MPSYGLGRMLTDCLAAPLKSGTVFTALAQRPDPSYAVMTINLLVFTALALIIAALGVTMRIPFNDLAFLFPMASGLAAPHSGVLAVITAGAILTTILWAAALLHGFMLLCGGQGGFSRSYETISLLSPCLLLQALLNWFDWAWVLPTLLAAYLAAKAARILHNAVPSRAAAIFSVLAILCLTGQWWARAQAGRWMQEARGLHEISQAAQALAPGPALSEANCDPASAQCAAANPAQKPLAFAPSGLNYLLSPGKIGSPMSALAPDQSVQQEASAMMRPVMDMLNNPKLSAGMPPEQAKQMQELRALMKMLQGAMADPKSLSPQQAAQTMRQLQTMAMQMMSQMQKHPGESPQKPPHAP